jgi:hypothetical protein
MTKFTIEELNTVLNLLDVATKAGGLAVAAKALPIVGKLEEMARELQADAPNNVVPIEQDAA